MRRPRLAWAVLIGMIGLGAAACGNSGGSPLSPASLSTITGITLAVNPPGVGATVTATATLSLSTGNFAVVSSGFTSDTPSVATVTAVGAVTGVSIGDVTIAVDYQGFKASRKVRVLPNYAGVFYGSYTLDACVDSGGFTDSGFCAGFSAGSIGYLAVSNLQSADLTTLIGQFILDPDFLIGLGTTTGTISPSGNLAYAGMMLSGTKRADFRNFTGASPSVGHINGHFELVWTDSTMTGSGVKSCTIVDLVRSGG